MSANGNNTPRMWIKHVLRFLGHWEHRLQQGSIAALDAAWPWVRTAAQLAGRLLLALLAALGSLPRWALARTDRLPLPERLRHRREALLVDWEDRRHDTIAALQRSCRSLWDRLTARYGKRQMQRATIVTLLVALLVSSLGGIVTLLPRLGHAASTSHEPNTLARFLSTGDAWEQGRAPFTEIPPRGTLAHDGLPPDKAPPSSGAPLTHPIRIALDAQHLYNGADPVGAPEAAPRAKSSEGILELQVANHAVDLGAASVPGAGSSGAALTASQAGPLTLELQPTSGTFRGESMTLAGFALHVVDTQHREAQGVKLHAPLLLTFHYQPHELAGLNPASLRLVWPATADQQHNRPATFVPVTVNTQNQTLSASVATLQSGPMVLSASSSDANTASSEHIQMPGNQGDASFTVPFDLPSAAGGLAPALQLVYSSAGPNGRYARNAPAPWVGDGWDLSLGSISYDTSKNMYYLNGVGGVSDVLLCCSYEGGTGTLFFLPHHHDDVRIFTSDNSTNPNQTGACFHVRTPDGLEYELGCTSDSKRSTVNGSTLSYIEWDVDKVQRRAANAASGYLQQYIVSYWQDTATSGSQTYTRDAGLKEIDYNYVGGAAQVRVSFNVHWPGSTTTSGPATATSYGTNYNCASTPLQSTTLRCDDPVQPSGYEPTPLTMATLTLDSVAMQVQSGGAWHTVRIYQLGYAADAPAVTWWDDTNGQQVAGDGEHLLTSVQETPYQIVSGADTATPSRQPLTFTYTNAEKNEYHDMTHNGFDGNPFNAQTWWQYLTGFTDKQTGAGATVQYKEAWGNTHGVPSGSNVQDPFTCGTVSCTVPQDRQWPRHAVYSITDTGVTPNTTTTYSYRLNQACGSGCTQDTWIPPNSWNACGDNGLPPQNPNQSCLTTGYTNYYNEEYTGFQDVYTTHPDGSTSFTRYYAGSGWGSNDWDNPNMLRGLVTQEDAYQGAASGTPLREALHTYLNGTTDNACPGNNVGTGGNQLYVNPYLFCFQREKQRDTYIGGSSTTSPAVPHQTQTWTYDPYFWFETLDSTATTGNDLLADSVTNYGSTQPTFTTTYTYTGRDGFLESPQTPYYFERLTSQTTVDDNLGNRWSCTQSDYDGTSFSSNWTNTSILSALPTQGTTYADCGTSGNGYTMTGGVSTGTGYDTYGQTLVTTDADANAGISGHTGCTASASLLTVWPSASTYTTCTTYDSAQHAYAAGAANALNQTTATTWDVVQGVSTASTDANGVVTNLAGPIYEYSGSPSLATYQDTYVQTTEPGETYGSPAWTTRVFSFSFCAGTTTGGKPCIETDTVRQLDGTNLLVSRQFYDRDGRLLETRTSGPAIGQDTIKVTSYDDVNHKTFASLPCYVSSLTTSNGGRSVSSTPGYIAPTQTASGSSAYVDPSVSGTSCYNVSGTTTYFDTPGRTIATDDAIGTGVGTSGTGCLLPGGNTHHTTCAVYTAVVASSIAGLPTSDNEPYAQTLGIDANLHQSASYSDALGHTAYSQRFSGASQNPRGSGISSYSVTSSKYDGAGNLAQVSDPASHVTTFTYDKLGRQTALTDPDKGSQTYSYDPNGNRTQTVDARGSSGTVYAGYDGLNRQLWRNTTNSSSGAYATYAYDSTAGGNKGVGRTTSETFSGGANSGSYSYTYDARGQKTNTTLVVNGTSYPLGSSYDDAGDLVSQTYPTGETVTTSYSATGALMGLSQTLGGTPTTLLSNVTYNGTAGAAELITSASLGGGTYNFSATYDGLLRVSDLKTTRTSDGATLFEEAPSYDNVSNVFSTTETLPAGVVVSQFCYDAQDRITWVGTHNTAPCTGSAVSGTTLSGAIYSISYGYDTLDRLTANWKGTYAYGDSAHLHGITSITNSGTTTYSASYDAAGDMACRAPSSSTTCAGGSPTGGVLAYDNEGRMTAWQNAPSSPTTTASYLYDGEGQRVLQAVTTAGATTTSVYVGAVEDVVTTGGATTTSTYYYAAGKRIALAYNGSLSYLASDHLGSAETGLDGSGNVQGSRLFDPYGQTYYATGWIPGSYGYTGQHYDSPTALNYYGARYYDPAVGQFTSADTVRDGQNPFLYVGGNPETHNDPTGHCPWCIGIVVGAIVGAAISYGAQVVANVQSGKSLQDSMTQVNVAEIGKAALAGAIIGATGGLAAAGIGGALGIVGVTGVTAEIGGAALTGAVEGAGGQVIDNVLHGRDWSDNVGEAAAFGAVTGGFAGAAGVGVRAFARRMAGAVEEAAAEGTEAAAEGASGASCPLSFSPDTPVATPSGKQTIGSVQVGDPVTAYDPSSGTTSAQTVQHVWINHDNDLLDVTLATGDALPQAQAGDGTTKLQEAAVASHGLRAPPSDTHTSSDATATETVHTTKKHPWLTTDQGWVKAGQLAVGEQVVREGGTLATITALRDRPGAADYYNLTVSQLHTYAVGVGQYVVHNCDDTWDQVKTLSNGQTKADFAQAATECFYCGRTDMANAGTRRLRGVISRTIEHIFPRKLATKFLSQEEFDLFVADTENLRVACNICNSSKQDDMIGDWHPSRAGAEEESLDVLNRMRSKYGLP